jgi:hypothetical protein
MPILRKALRLLRPTRLADEVVEVDDMPFSFVASGRTA